MVEPYIVSYHQHFENNLKELMSKSRGIEPECLLAAIDHLRSVTCTPFDFQKTDILLKVNMIKILVDNVNVRWQEEIFA